MTQKNAPEPSACYCGKHIELFIHDSRRVYPNKKTPFLAITGVDFAPEDIYNSRSTRSSVL
jgi:hypothetical protein